MNRVIALVLSLLCFFQMACPARGYEKKESEAEQYEIIVELSENKSVTGRNSAVLMGKDFDVAPETLYTCAINGFSAKATKEDIARLENSPEVSNVYIARQYLVPAMGSSGGGNGTLIPSVPDGYGGQGTAVAVLDSEFLVDHEYFTLTDETTVKYAKSDIEAKLTGLSITAKLTELGIEVSADDFYRSAKVPFAYDYADRDNNTVSTRYHGTSVAGAAAGQNSTHKGSAPEAQLILMKVFSNDGKTNDTTVLAAIDDAIKLGADVINISFGAEAGLSSPLYEHAFSNARESGILVTCAAGNNAMAEYSTSDTGPLSSNPDYGTIASPSMEDSATAVGAFASTGTALNNGFQSVSGTMAAFSSRGATSNLKLKPEITGKGNRVYLPHGSGKITYNYVSGTSFSAPYLAGLSATLKGYVNENYDVPEEDKPLLCENLLLSTSDVISNGGVPYSPRAQGAGAANIEKAITTPVVLYGIAGGKAKAELGDQLSDTISFSFTAKNLTENDVTYSLCAAAVTDDYKTENNESRIKMTSRPLTGAEFSFGEESVTVPAFGTVSIEVTLTLDSSETEALTGIFHNGFFVDGFIQLSSDLEPTLNFPFTGFYGNWLSVPVFDAPVSRGGGEYDVTGLVRGGDYLGSVFDSTEVRDSYMAVKPGDNTLFAAALLRNVSEMNVEIIDEGGNTVKTGKIGDGMRKVFYNDSYNEWNYEESSSWKWEKTTGTLSEGIYTCKITAILDCSGSSGAPQSIEFNVFVDSTAPRISDISLILDDEGYSFNIEAEDNHIAGIAGVSDTITNLFSAMENNFAAIRGASADFKYIQVWDCAGNVGFAQISASNGYIAYYDENELINVVRDRIALWNNRIITETESKNTVKIFAWEGMTPAAKRKLIKN